LGGFGTVDDALRLTGAASGRALGLAARAVAPPFAADGSAVSLGSFLKNEKTTLPSGFVNSDQPA
jgi:hypothetical protein